MSAFIKLNMKTLFQYRKTFFLSAIIQPIELIVGIVIFTSVYKFGNYDTIHGYSLTQMVWYIGGMQILGNIIWNITDSRVSNQILDGSLSIHLLKPASLFQFELANAVAFRSIGILFETIPILAIQSILFFPSFLTWVSTMKFAVCALLSFFLFFLVNFLVGMAAFIIKSNSSIISFKFILISFFGGTMIIPLDFFPEWLQTVSLFMPFRYLYYDPLQFFLNRETAQSLSYFGQVVGMQMLWIALLYLTIKLLWPRVIKRYCAVGG